MGLFYLDHSAISLFAARITTVAAFFAAHAKQIMKAQNNQNYWPILGKSKFSPNTERAEQKHDSENDHDRALALGMTAKLMHM